MGRGGVGPNPPQTSRFWEDPHPRWKEGHPLGGLAAPQTPLLTRGASPPGPSDLHSEGTEALELIIQALESLFKL